MSRKGDCWFMSPMESFFGTLKTESLHRFDFATRDEERRGVRVHRDLLQPQTQALGARLCESGRVPGNGKSCLKYVSVKPGQAQLLDSISERSSPTHNLHDGWGQTQGAVSPALGEQFSDKPIIA